MTELDCSWLVSLVEYLLEDLCERRFCLQAEQEEGGSLLEVVTEIRLCGGGVAISGVESNW